MHLSDRQAPARTTARADDARRAPRGVRAGRARGAQEAQVSSIRPSMVFSAGVTVRPYVDFTEVQARA